MSDLFFGFFLFLAGFAAMFVAGVMRHGAENPRHWTIRILTAVGFVWVFMGLRLLFLAAVAAAQFVSGVLP